jgi:drug/metabolite transporter (DMT)-like permease
MQYKWLFLVSVTLFGISSFLNRLAADKINPYYIHVVASSTGLILIPLHLYLAQTTKQDVIFNTAGVLLTFSSAILSIVGSLIFMFAIRKVQNVGSLSMILSLYPSIGLILAVIFLHEKIKMQQIIAFALMVTGAMMMSLL